MMTERLTPETLRAHVGRPSYGDWGDALESLRHAATRHADAWEAEVKHLREQIEKQRAALKLAMGYLATHGPRDERDAGAHFAAVTTVEAALAVAAEFA